MDFDGIQGIMLLCAYVNGEYYYSDSAWEYVKKETGVDLLAILQRIANERDNGDASK